MIAEILFNSGDVLAALVNDDLHLARQLSALNIVRSPFVSRSARSTEQLEERGGFPYSPDRRSSRVEILESFDAPEDLFGLNTERSK